MSISSESLTRILRRRGFPEGADAIESYGERAERNSDRRMRKREEFLRFVEDGNYQEMDRIIDAMPAQVLNVALYNVVDRGDNDRSLIEYLLDNGADPLADNMNIFQLAAEKGTQDILDLFYGYGVTPDRCGGGRRFLGCSKKYWKLGSVMRITGVWRWSLQPRWGSFQPWPISSLWNRSVKGD